MIRRDALTADGSPGWILIPQIAHAQLAGDLADSWRFGQFDESSLVDLRYADRLHDDGWADWDARPSVDPASGLPINFDQMRLADALSIWERSIEISTIHAPLAGYLVAGHFCRLLARFDSWRQHADTQQLATHFLACHASRMDALLASWQLGGPAHRTREVAELGVSYIQLFDAISLWLCCAPRQEPWTATLPTGEVWTFSPLSAASGSSASRVPAQRISGFHPWPLDRPELTVRAIGRSVPRGQYRSPDELLTAPSEPVQLTWELIPR